MNAFDDTHTCSHTYAYIHMLMHTIIILLTNVEVYYGAQLYTPKIIITIT